MGIRADESPGMHTWLLRHRARLRLIYGLSAPPASAPEVREEEPQREPAGEPRQRVRRLRGAKRRPAPGTLQRRSSYVLLAPMPRKSA
jgi:hypothetical protein